VSQRSRPTLTDLTLVLSHMADRVSAGAGDELDPIVMVSLQRALRELRQFIPGLDAPPDPHAARFFAAGARSALETGLHRDALARALRGLSFAPHDPQLHYLAACACFELGCVREAVDGLLHTLWIHPGHPEARRDLEALAAFRAPPDEGPECAAAEGDPLEQWDEAPDDGDRSQLSFELADDDPGVALDDFLDALGWEDVTDRDDEPPPDDSEDRRAA